jgi:hypothetical protein
VLTKETTKNRGSCTLDKLTSYPNLSLPSS